MHMQRAQQQMAQQQRAQQQQAEQQQDKSQGFEEGQSGDKSSAAKVDSNETGNQKSIKSSKRRAGDKGDRNVVLADMSASQQKNYLGEKLYPLVRSKLSSQQSGSAGKVTGMLLEGLSSGELLKIIEDPSELSRKVDEAVNVLESGKK